MLKLNHFILMFFSLSHCYLNSHAVEVSSQSDICLESSIIGTWEWYKYKYDGGSDQTPRNPDLHLTFQFNSQGESGVSWNTNLGMCERKGQYEYIVKQLPGDEIKNDQYECILHDKIVWVNPKNALGCSQDPDMQMDRESYNRLETKDGELWLYLDLSGKSLIYIFKRLQ